MDLKENGNIEIISSFETFFKIQTLFESSDFNYTTGVITQVPSQVITLNTIKADQVISVIEKLEDDLDVQEVFANFEIKL